MGLTLGFDTATAATTVALARGDEILAEARHDPGPGERPGHQTMLLPLIDRVFSIGSAGWDDIERLAVGIGPGTFTGLRIGIATARALAQARGLGVVGVSTLEALAVHAIGPDPSACILAVLDARRGEAFAAAWVGGQRVLAPAALSPDALAAAAAGLPSTPLAVGDGAVRFRERLEAIGADIPPDADAVHRVSAREHCRLAAGVPAGGPDQLLPEYLRVPDAKITNPERAT
jgi:tRNA threonylcarbamoyladenosine biosynthesis protein TsaB